MFLLFDSSTTDIKNAGTIKIAMELIISFSMILSQLMFQDIGLGYMGWFNLEDVLMYNLMNT